MVSALIKRIDTQPLALRQILDGSLVAGTMLGKNGAQQRNRINRVKYGRPLKAAALIK